MSNENGEDDALFQLALDNDHTNHKLRLIFADWLEERGDWRAAGYRWMGTNKHCPEEPDPILENDRINWRHHYNWLTDIHSWKLPESPAIIDREIYSLLKGIWADSDENGVYKTRREAEEDLCRVIYELQTSQKIYRVPHQSG